MMPSPQEAADKWASSMQAAGAKYTAGVQAVAVAPGTLASRAKDRYAQGTAAAVDRFAANSARVTREEWISITVAKGAPRLGSGASAAKEKTAQAFTRVFGWIDQTVRALPPRGDIEANIARSGAFARGMHNLKMSAG